MLTDLEAEHFDSGNADIDLCCAVQSKIFVQGKGYFSKLIAEIRKNLTATNQHWNTILNENLVTIEV